MRVEYLQVNGSSERFNVDVYTPDAVRGVSAGTSPLPGVIMVAGGGGKDLVTGEQDRGKYQAAYHDLAEEFAANGIWAFVPSRRGDPQRTAQLIPALSATFRERLPLELFSDNGPNDGIYTHYRQLEELKTLVGELPELCGSDLDLGRLGVLGKSAGGGVALALAAQMKGKVASVFLWGSALRTSQWFENERADEYFERIFAAKGVRYEREDFLRETCDAIDYVKHITAPLLLACAFPDPYSSTPPVPDPYTTIDEQVNLLRYALNVRYGRAVTVKGAEHTMCRESPAWQNYVSTIVGWFKETL